jgi:ribosomal protein L30/L7E
VSGLRPIAQPFVVAAPGGARVRTRLRVTGEDAWVLQAAGTLLGSLAGQDLAARCGQGWLDAKGRAASRRVRKQALTARCSSRWAGAITRTSEDAYRLAVRNLEAEAASLRVRIRRIQTRLAVPCGQKVGRVRGYADRDERHVKTVRLQRLRARLAVVTRQLAAGVVSVTRGGKRLLHKRNNLAAAGLTQQQWRSQWQAARLFLTADGEVGKVWGNETIRFNPDEGWLEIKLPTALAYLANRPHGRYRLSGLVRFSYRGDDVAAQAATGAVRYDISVDPGKDRWYLDASWRTPDTPMPTLADLRAFPTVSVDVNHGHLDVSVITPDGNVLGQPDTIAVELADLPATTRNGRIRAVVSDLIGRAKAAGAHSIVIENLDFASARAEGRERSGDRPARGKRGRAFRRLVTGIPTGRLRACLVQMAFNAGLAVVAVDPAYTSRWAAQWWLAPLCAHHPETSGHHAAAVVIGRRGLGHRARRRVTGNQPAPEEAGRSTQTRPGHIPAARARKQEPRPPTRRPATARRKTATPHRTRTGDQAAQDRSGPPATQDTLLLAQ